LRDEDVPGALCHRPSAEIHLGYLRGALGNVEGYVPESRGEYVDPEFYLPGRFYAVGIWWNGRENLRSGGASGDRAVIILPYEAKEVNVVLSSSDPMTVEIEQDDAPIPESAAGSDVKRRPDGTTVLEVHAARMYRAVKNPLFGTHRLKLTVRKPGLEVYAFSFVTSVMVQPFSEN
jgi:hypothetical protein